MGEWMKPRNVKWGNETELARFLIQRTMRCENRSHTVRTALHLVRDIIEAGILPEVLTRVQGLQCAHTASVGACAHTLQLVPSPKREYRYAWHGIAASAVEAREFMGMLLREAVNA